MSRLATPIRFSRQVCDDGYSAICPTSEPHYGCGKRHGKKIIGPRLLEWLLCEECERRKEERASEVISLRERAVIR